MLTPTAGWQLTDSFYLLSEAPRPYPATSQPAGALPHSAPISLPGRCADHAACPPLPEPHHGSTAAMAVRLPAQAWHCPQGDSSHSSWGQAHHGDRQQQEPTVGQEAKANPPSDPEPWVSLSSCQHKPPVELPLAKLVSSPPYASQRGQKFLNFPLVFKKQNQLRKCQ